MSDEIKTNEGRVVGSWDGNSAEALKQELARIRQVLASEGKGEKVQFRDVPHRDQLPADLHSFNAYPSVGLRQERFVLGGRRCKQDRAGRKGACVLVGRSPLILS